MFLLCVVMSAATLLLGRAVIPAHRHGPSKEQRSLDATGSISAALVLAPLVFALNEGETAGWASAEVLDSLAVSALALVAFILGQLRKGRQGHNPLMPMGIWRSRPFIAANLGGFAYFAAFFGVLFFHSLDLQEQRGYSALAAGFAFLPMTLAMSLTGTSTGRLMSRFGAAAVMIAGLLVATVGTVLLASTDSATPLMDVEWRLLLIGVGCGLLSSSISNLAVSSVPDRLSNSASATQNTFRQIGSTLGMAGLGIIIHGNQAGFSAGLRTGMMTIGGLLAACAVVSFMLVLRASPKPSTA